MNEPKRPSFLFRLRKAADVLFPRNADALTGNPIPRPQNPVSSWGGAKITPKEQRERDAAYQGSEPFLSPGSPLDPRMEEGSPPRRFQAPPGYNIQIQPRSTEGISFAQLRGMSEYTLVRVIIEHVKESLKSHEWAITPDEEEDPRAYPDEIKMLTEFFEMPDRSHTWDEWLGMMIEEVITIDALSIFKRRTRGGELYALDIIDGGTIKPLSTADGFEPQGDIPAYQQFLYGVPYVNMLREDLYYLPRNRRANKFYGYSPIEQMIVTINQGLRREIYSLAQLTDGNIPVGVGCVPKEWTIDMVKAFQEYWDTILAGDPQNRSRIRFVPEGFNYQKFHDGTDGDGMGLFSPFDEWISRVLCFALGISPMPFIKLTNRAVAQEMGDVEAEGGVGSMKLFIERFINRVIDYDFKMPHLCFNWVTDRSRMQQKRVDRNVKYVNAGIFQIDEVRAEEGKDPLNLPPGYPTPAGYVTFEGAIAAEQAGLEAQDAATENLKNPPGDPQLDQKQEFQAEREDNRTKIEDRRRKEDARASQQQARAINATRDTSGKRHTQQQKAQKAWEKARFEELEKWERFALSRSPIATKASNFECEFIDDEEAKEIRVALIKAMNVEPGLSKDVMRKAFDEEIKHVFAYRKSKIQPIRLAPAASHDATQKVGDLRNVLNAAFQQEARRIAAKKSPLPTVKMVKPIE